MPGLGVSFGRGAATSFQEDLQNSDCILIMGANMAEAHPVGFRFPMKARERGATLIHIDPHFSRTSAMCNMYVPIRTGSDIAFLGGLINYVIQNDLWFREYVMAFTNATTLINDEYVDAEDMGGLFQGFNPDTGHYEHPETRWNYKDEPHFSSTERPHHIKHEGWSQKLGNLENPMSPCDPSLEHPHCVFNILKHHYARYTTEMVARVCGCTEEQFLSVAETLCRNSGRDRTSAIVYALGWTQHTTGVQMIRAAGILQLLLGNVGRPGGGIMAMRGHASIQGSTDISTLYNTLPGYISQPADFPEHNTLKGFLEKEKVKSGYWANLPKFMISMLKAWYGEGATEANDYGYRWVPHIDDDYSHFPIFIKMAEGKVKGLFLFGQNPAGGGPNAGFHRAAMMRLDWLVVRDWFEIESACFWYKGPEAPAPETIGTEIFFMPAAGPGEKDGCLTNTQRLLQWHDKAIDPPGDCRSDTWFLYHLGRRLKQLYEDSDADRDQGLLNLTWDYARDNPEILPDGTPSRIHDEPDVEKVLMEINGYTVADRKQIVGFADLKDDGTTASGCWIYCGCFPEEGRNRTRSRKTDPNNYTSPDWGFAWPANRRLQYNRASADPDGKPWSERKKYIWWDEAQGKWTGLDAPDFELNKPPSYRPKQGDMGMAAISGASPFIMKPDGKGWLYAPMGMKDGPLPTHYEPIETPVSNLLYRQQQNPAVDRYDLPLNPKAPPLDPDYPVVGTTYRLTEHYLSGPMSRFNSWLNELQPEMFAEISPELAAEHGIEHGGWMVVTSARTAIEVRAMVTRRMKPLYVHGRVLHQIGLPFHWGYAGEVVGSNANDVTSIVTDPNVSIHEAKTFTCRVSAGRLTRPKAEDPPLIVAPWPTREPAPDTLPSGQPEGQGI